MSSSNDDYELIFWLLGLGPIFFYRGFQKLKLRRKIIGLATSRARSMAMGTVELSGVAAKQAEISDPIYQRACVYYTLTVEEMRGSGKNKHWETIYSECSDGKPFLCRDGTGDILIVPKKPELHLSQRISKQNGFFGADKTSAEIVFMSRWGGFGRSLRLTANIIREGDPIFILGSALPSSTNEILTEKAKHSTNLTEADAARLLKNNAEQMKKLDTNHDGNVDSLEWEKGFAEFRKYLQEKKTNEQKSKAGEKYDVVKFAGMVTASPDAGLIFANSEKQLLSKVGTFAMLAVWGGGAAFLAGLALLLIKLRWM